MALVERDGKAYALVLLDGVDTLLMIDLRRRPRADPAHAPPLGIGEMPDGSF
jgi:hypothetical protein